MILFLLALMGAVPAVDASLFCDRAIDRLVEARFETSRRSCLAIVVEADRQGVDRVAAVALGYHETRLRDLPSYAGRRMLARGVPYEALPEWVERGPLQAKPRALCPGRRAKGCDFIEAAVSHLRIQRRRSKTWEETFARYKLPNRPDFGYGSRAEGRRTRLACRLDARRCER